MEKVKLPQYMADVVNQAQRNQLYSCDTLEYILDKRENCQLNGNVNNWLEVGDNLITLTHAIVNGYKVEEQLYYVKLANSFTSYLTLDIEKGGTLIDVGQNNEWYKSRFTLEEIKEIDERYLPFAVEVDIVDGICDE